MCGGEMPSPSATNPPKNTPPKASITELNYLSHRYPRVSRVLLCDVTHLMPRCWADSKARNLLSRQIKRVCYICEVVCHVL